MANKGESKPADSDLYNEMRQEVADKSKSEGKEQTRWSEMSKVDNEMADRHSSEKIGFVSKARGKFEELSAQKAARIKEYGRFGQPKEAEAKTAAGHDEQQRLQVEMTKKVVDSQGPDAKLKLDTLLKLQGLDKRAGTVFGKALEKMNALKEQIQLVAEMARRGALLRQGEKGSLAREQAATMKEKYSVMSSHEKTQMRDSFSSKMSFAMDARKIAKLEKIAQRGEAALSELGNRGEADASKRELGKKLEAENQIARGAVRQAAENLARKETPSHIDVLKVTPADVGGFDYTSALSGSGEAPRDNIRDINSAKKIEQSDAEQRAA